MLESWYNFRFLCREWTLESCSLQNRYLETVSPTCIVLSDSLLWPQVLGSYYVSASASLALKSVNSNLEDEFGAVAVFELLIFCLKDRVHTKIDSKTNLIWSSRTWTSTYRLYNNQMMPGIVLKENILPPFSQSGKCSLVCNVRGTSYSWMWTVSGVPRHVTFSFERAWLTLIWYVGITLRVNVGYLNWVHLMFNFAYKTLFRSKCERYMKLTCFVG